MNFTPGEFQFTVLAVATNNLSKKEVTVPVIVVDHPLIKHKLALMREDNVSTKDFRDLASELATLLTYEATKDLETETKTIQ